MERVADLTEPIKPKLRGWFHAGMVPAALIAGVVLICLAGTQQAVLACAVYSVTAWMLFATSAIYHRGTWGPLGEALLRRLDHANIFLIIAGTCTPLAVLLLPSEQRSVLLWIVWTGALAGIAFRVLWVGAPRWLYTPCYLALSGRSNVKARHPPGLHCVCAGSNLALGEQGTAVAEGVNALGCTEAVRRLSHRAHGIVALTQGGNPFTRRILPSCRQGAPMD
ncbi:hemolysin III family protein [Streptomyces sp. NPDC090057]|uniref:PAQR family membrane homeostasis protein TrhA n=1 Tax=Streptomyces sp. NPDC090057 TaxID=3365935 RepID=UPI0037FA5D03